MRKLVRSTDSSPARADQPTLLQRHLFPSCSYVTSPMNYIVDSADTRLSPQFSPTDWQISHEFLAIICRKHVLARLWSLFCLVSLHTVTRSVKTVACAFRSFFFIPQDASVNNRRRNARLSRTSAARTSKSSGSTVRKLRYGTGKNEGGVCWLLYTCSSVLVCCLQLLFI